MWSKSCTMRHYAWLWDRKKYNFSLETNCLLLYTITVLYKLKYGKNQIVVFISEINHYSFTRLLVKQILTDFNTVGKYLFNFIFFLIETPVFIIKCSLIRGCSEMTSPHFGPFWTLTPLPVTKNHL